MGLACRTTPWTVCLLTRRLNAVSPDNPVILGHASGHAAFWNDKSPCEEAGVTDDTRGSGRRHDRSRTASGKATGLMRETAQRLISDAQASVRGADDARRGRQHCERERVQLGCRRITAPTALRRSTTPARRSRSIDLFKELEEEGALDVRHVPDDAPRFQRGNGDGPACSTAWSQRATTS